jgi:DHA1 family tetracycline resistance protein-like MFS transporter
MNDDELTAYLAKYNISQRTAMITLMLSIFVDVLGFSLILPLLPSIAKEVGASDFMVGIIISANPLMGLIFGPIWGTMSDKYGRKPVLLVSQIGTCAAFLVLATADAINIIIFARLLDGIFGGQMPIVRAIISDITTPATRTEKVGTMMVGAAMGAIFGPVIGGFLGAINWRYPPLFTAILSIISIILTLTVLVETMPKSRREDLRAKRAQQHEAAIKRPSLLKNPEVNIRLWQFFIFDAIVVMFTSSIALVVDKRYGGGPREIGILMMFVVVAMIVIRGRLMTPMIRRFGEKKLYFFVIWCAVFSFFAFPWLSAFWMMFVFMFPFVLFMVIGRPIINVNITKAVEEDRQGEVSGYATTVQGLAESLTPLLATGYLEIGSVNVGSFEIGAYLLIGATSILMAVVLRIVAARDIQKYPAAYEDPRDLLDRKKMMLS